MQVAVIGTGNMGSGLASILAQAKHEVTIGSRDMAKAATLASQIGHGAVGGDIEAAVKMADVVILAIPFPFAEETLKAAGDLSKKIIIDISNPITPDFQSLLIGHTTSAAEEIQKLAPAAKVVKAFNTIFAQLLPTEARAGKTLQVFVAADDAGAKAEVSALVKSLGFDAVDAGPLINSRFIEPIGEMNIHFGYFLGWGPVSAPMWPRA